VQRAFDDSVENRTCRFCGHVTAQPEGWAEDVAAVAVGSDYAADPLALPRGRSW